jgi:3-dehydroquinate synthase
MVIDIKPQKKLNLAPLQQHICVNFHYAVHFTTGLFQLDNNLLAEVIGGNNQHQPPKILAVIDGGLLQYQPKLIPQLKVYINHYSDILNLVDEPIIIPGGEAAKNDSHWLEKIQITISEVGLCRHSYVLAIGGGAVLDVAGYAAATAHRGIRLVRVPTTVLGQNDSGVGIKNGINAFNQKNFLGTFTPPYAVLNDFDFITSVDDRDWRSGMAEAIKVSLIKDREFFDFISTNASYLVNRDMEVMRSLIYRCAKLHLEHIANYGDPFEMGSSRPLDFGHWVAHKLENLTNYSLRHGEAVAIGIALDSTYSYLQGFLTQGEWKIILQTFQDLGFILYVPELANYLDQLEHPRCIFHGLTEFQQHLGGELTLMMLEEIGKGVEVHHVDIPVYIEAIKLLQNWR